MSFPCLTATTTESNPLVLCFSSSFKEYLANTSTWKGRQTWRASWSAVFRNQEQGIEHLTFSLCDTIAGARMKTARKVLSNLVRMHCHSDHAVTSDAMKGPVLS